MGYELFDLLHAATVLPVMHYKLPVGLLQPGDPADFIITREFRTMKIEETWINGEKVFANGEVLFNRVPPGCINHFVSSSVSPEDFRLLSDRPVQEVIVAEDRSEERRVGKEWGSRWAPDQ